LLLLSPPPLFVRIVRLPVALHQRSRRATFPASATTFVDAKPPFVAASDLSQKDFGPVSKRAGAAASAGLVPDQRRRKPALLHPRGRFLRRTSRQKSKDITMFIRTISLLGALAATAATIALATPASAQQAEDRTVVSLAGLDLSSPADATRLDNRLRAAARKVCGPDQSKDRRIHQETIACEKSAIARATSDVQVALRGSSGTTVALTTN
jgi:UrcA family protein